MKIERTKNAKRNIIFGTLLKCYQIAVPFAMRTIMIYVMGVQYLGLNSLFTSVLQVLNLAELGVGSAMVYSMYKPIAEDDEVAICALMRLYKVYYRIIGLVIAIAGLALVPFIPRLITGQIPSEINIYLLYILYLASTVASYWLFAYKNCLLQAHQRNDVASKVSIIIYTLQYAFQAIVLFLTHNYYLYVIVALLSQVLTNISTAIVVQNMFPDYRAVGDIGDESKRAINSRIKDLFFIKIGSVVVDSADTIVISAFLGLELLAIYQNYYFIMNSVYSIVCIVFTSITAGIGNSLIIESKEKNYSDFKTLTFIMSWIICVCCCCFLGMYQTFMNIWVGRELMLDFMMVVLFCIYFYVRQTAMIWATVKDAVGLWHKDRLRALIGAFINLILNISLVDTIGLYGILISTIISVLFVSWPWLIHNVFKYIYQRSVSQYLISIFKYSLSTIGTCVLVALTCNLVPDTGIIFLIFRAAISLAVSNIVLLALYRNADEFRVSLVIAKRMVKGK